jgi:molybdopterin-binding protein
VGLSANYVERTLRRKHGQEAVTMEISARNQLPATVKSIKVGDIVAEVVMDVHGTEVAAVITRSSVEALGLKVGDQVKAVIKATEVMVAR